MGKRHTVHVVVSSLGVEGFVCRSHFGVVGATTCGRCWGLLSWCCWVSGCVCVGVRGAMPRTLFGASGVMSEMPSRPEAGFVKSMAGVCPDIVCRNPTSTRAVTDSGRQIHRPEKLRSESTKNRKARVSFLLWGARAHVFFLRDFVFCLFYFFSSFWPR